MPYNKKSSDKDQDKRGKDFDKKKNDYGKNQDQPFKRDSYAKKKGDFNPTGPGAGRKPYKPKDNNELAPPRFLPPSPLGKKPYSGPKREDSGSYGRKPAGKPFAKDPSTEKRDYSKSKDKASDSGWGADDFATKFFDKNKKRSSERPYERNNDGAGKDFKRPDRPVRREGGDQKDRSTYNSDRPVRREGGERNDRNGYSSDRPVRREGGDQKDRNGYNSDRPVRREGSERNDRNGYKSDRTEKSPQDKKPFRPGYETEVKSPRSYKDKPKDKPATKSKNDRKKELLGIVDEPTDIRLNKYIANSGICARREADELIKKGLVTVNGKVVTEMGHKVKKEDVVTYDGRKILPEPFVYILMNKPKDFITTTDDEKGRKTVLDLLADKIPQRIYPIGRLDRNTTGVLLLTNDGEVAQALTHPAFEIKKVYHVVLDKKVSSVHLDQLVEGITLEDGLVFADAVSFVDAEDKSHVGVEIHSGKNRVIRRMFEHLGYEVEKLDRVSVGVFTKKDLPRGKWRFLSPSEIGFLMKLKSKM